MRKRLVALLLLLGAASLATADQSVVRDLPPGLQIPLAAQPGPNFDVDQATKAYLELLSPEQRRLSDRHFEGGYWLQLWYLLWTIGACALLVFTGISRRMSEFSQRLSRSKWISTPIYVLQFFIVLSVLTLPLTLYDEFFRAHRYGLTEQSLEGFMTDQAIVIIANALLATIALTVIYAAVRRAGARWWIWASGFSFVFLLVVQLIAPVYLMPLLNDYQPLPDGPQREAVLSLARANRIPTDKLEWFDASKQTTRASANVSGLLNTTRIALNDNLLNKTSLPEIRAVVSHEMGHYALNHAFKQPLLLALIIGFALWLIGKGMDFVLARWGTRLMVTDRADPAALPIAVALFALIFFLLTPLQNLVVRSYESQADAFALGASREPHGFAMAAMRTSTYRKTQPSAFEEFVFYNHPSPYRRVRAAMVWIRDNQSAMGE